VLFLNLFVIFRYGITNPNNNDNNSNTETPPETVYSERLFPTSGLIVDKRNKLNSNKLRMLVFLNKNLDFKWLKILNFKI